jgi:hypothetical protein
MYGYIGILSAFLLFIIVTGFFTSSSLGANCDPDADHSWHWISISAIDTFQAFTIMTLTLLFCKRA